MSADAFSVRQDAVDLQELIWDVINGRHDEIERAGLDVAVMVRDAARLYTLGDYERLRWALGHMLQNAIRYTETEGHILISMRRDRDDNAVIQVADNGVGISEKDLPHVFERFYRGEPRTSSGKLLDPRGLGQGLFIARKVAEAHRGYLGVNSESGQGSVFTLVLPIIATDPS
jgi:signal transduction histidine kinase